MAVDMFLKLDGIDGESQDDKHSKEVDLLSFTWGQTHDAAPGSTTVGAGSGVGKVSFSDFAVTFYSNKASAKVFSSCSGGKHIASAIITVRKSGDTPQEYLIITLTDVTVNSHNISCAQGGLSMETAALGFAKIEYAYSPQKSDGSLDAAVKANYNIQKNKAE